MNSNTLVDDIIKMVIGAILASILWVLYVIHIQNEAVDHGVGEYVVGRHGEGPNFRWTTPKVIINGR